MKNDFDEWKELKELERHSWAGVNRLCEIVADSVFVFLRIPKNKLKEESTSKSLLNEIDFLEDKLHHLKSVLLIIEEKRKIEANESPFDEECPDKNYLLSVMQNISCCLKNESKKKLAFNFLDGTYALKHIAKCKHKKETAEYELHLKAFLKVKEKMEQDFIRLEKLLFS